LKRDKEPVTVEKIRAAHGERACEIRSRLAEFSLLWRNASDEELLEELVFCIFTAGASARMGLRSVAAVRPLLKRGDHATLAGALSGVHRYPRARSGYIVVTREFLKKDCKMRLRDRLESFGDPNDRRDWLARERGIKGLGYKEASHFLRNVGFQGHAILDKHICRSLAELGVVSTPNPPSSRARYLVAEETMRHFARDVEINFDELDLVLWSMKSGSILK
jgi:N-glycosylase/DNA lyase